MWIAAASLSTASRRLLGEELFGPRKPSLTSRSERVIDQVRCAKLVELVDIAFGYDIIETLDDSLVSLKLHLDVLLPLTDCRERFTLAASPPATRIR
jgi:hypothetical protein